jgi:hypothetical protein
VVGVAWEDLEVAAEVDLVAVVAGLVLAQILVR